MNVRFAELLSEKATGQYEQALVHFCHGWCLEEAGRRDDAMRCYRAAAEYSFHLDAAQLAILRLRELNQTIPLPVGAIASLHRQTGTFAGELALRGQ